MQVMDFGGWGGGEGGLGAGKSNAYVDEFYIKVTLLFSGQLHPGVAGEHVTGGLLCPEATEDEPAH